MFKARGCSERNLLSLFFLYLGKFVRAGWASSTPKSGINWREGMSYARRKLFPRGENFWMENFIDKSRRTKSGNERKAVCKNKNKSFACSSRRKSGTRRKTFLTFYSRAKSLANFWKGRKVFRSRAAFHRLHANCRDKFSSRCILVEVEPSRNEVLWCGFCLRVLEEQPASHMKQAPLNFPPLLTHFSQLWM